MGYLRNRGSRQQPKWYVRFKDVDGLWKQRHSHQSTCPVPKVTRKGAGAAIPADPRNCRDVVRATVRAAGSVPVSIKIRLGLDDDRFTFRDAGKIAEDEGCAYIGLHARTVAQLYRGKARWEYIRELVEQIRIPVLGNGDIFRGQDAIRLMDETGCDGVIIGRGCLGNPWLFADLKRMFDGTGGEEAPSLEEVIRVIRLHYRLLCAHFTIPRDAGTPRRSWGSGAGPSSDPRGTRGGLTSPLRTCSRSASRARPRLRPRPAHRR